jgi:MFS superfamily sulfate permease-like transporter
MSTVSTRAGRWSSILARVAPGLPALLSYRGADLPRDLVAGLSVACVALPVGVAYAALAGFSPEVGLYSSILPLVAYALFGTSRQNGIALSIALGQLGKLFGFPIDAGGIIPRLLEFIGKLGLTHGPTLAVGWRALRCCW